MRARFLALLLITQACASGTNAQVPGVDSEALRLGVCRSEGQSIDLSKVMILENEWFDTQVRNEPARVRVQGDIVVFDQEGGGQRTRREIDVKTLISGGENLQIEVRLASYEGNLGIYWREASQAGQYAQGVFLFVDGEPVERCRGRGGVTRVH